MPRVSGCTGADIGQGGSRLRLTRVRGDWSSAVTSPGQVTEADRGRAALLAAVSHDLRAPLAAAKAAVSGLRSRDARLTAADR